MCFYRPTYQERNWDPQPPPTEEEIEEAMIFVRSLPPATPEEVAEQRRLGMITD